MAALTDARALANALSITPTEAARHGLDLNKDGQRRTAFELLSYPLLTFADVARVWPALAALPGAIAGQLEIDAKYAVYLERQQNDVAAYRRDENLAIPEWVDYAGMPGLSSEVRQKLETIRPRSIGQAGRIDGITPAALTLLIANIRRKVLAPASTNAA